MKIYPLHDLKKLTKETSQAIFEKFPKQSLKAASLFVYEKNDYIVRFDKSVEHLFFMIEGRAKIYKIHENGKRSLLQFLTTGDFIGELSLLEVEDQVKDVQTIDRCICLALPYHKVKQELLDDNHFLKIIAKYLGKKVLLRVEHFSNNQNYELKHRLAAYMLQTEVAGVYQEKHTETAEFLGVSYRHLIYTFKEFQQLGLIKKRGKGYKLNIAGLKDLALNLHI